MTQEIETFRNIILAMWQEQRDAWENGTGPNQPKTSHRDTYDRLARIPQFADRRQLEGALPKSDRPSVAIREAIVLPPILDETGCVPLLRMSCDFSLQSPEIRLHITLSRAQNRRLRCFPMRFETGAGIHRFRHAQLGNCFEATVPDWLPENQPSFPLHATCCVTLLLAALITLYGVDEVIRVVSEHPIHRREKYLKAIREWIDQ
jgi:hypothetical protein